MDQAENNRRGEVLDPVHEVKDENLKPLVEGVAFDDEVGTSRDVGKGSISGSNIKEPKEEAEEVTGQNKHDQENTCDKLSDQGTSYNSNNLVNQEELETVGVIKSVQPEYVNGEDRKLEAKEDESGMSLASKKATKGVSETDENSCVIDIKCSSCKEFYESSQGERICRICHLTSGQSSEATIVGIANSSNANSATTTSTDLIQLGCACKDELGIAHIHCAEAWFKLKGNRLCEICGETAKNVSGAANNGFMEGWNERRFMDNEINPSHRLGGCWRGQPFCNFLMACLVIAFVLPWFFRVNMF